MATARDDSYSGESGGRIIIGGLVIPPRVAHVFLETGQSNCQGVASTDSPIATGLKIGGIKTWRRSLNGNMYSGTGEWLDLEYATNQYEGRGQFGSILKFAINLRDNLEDENNHIYMIKADGNGKPISGWLSGGNEYNAMYSGHINPALADLAANPEYDEIRIHSFTWDQGESDSLNSTDADAYQAKLETVISDLRSNLGVPNLPVIIRRTESTEYDFVSTVAAAQDNIALNDSKVDIITGPWFYVADNKHLDGNSQNTVGDQRYTLTTAMTNGELYNV